MKTTKRSNENNMTTRFKKPHHLRLIAVATLFVTTFLTATGQVQAGSTENQGSISAAKPATTSLEVSPIYFLSADRHWFGFEPFTYWTFSVTNPDARRAATDVRARVVLFDKDGNEVVNKVFLVAQRIPPKKSAWVAPTVEYFGSNDLPNTYEDEGAGSATSGQVSIIGSSWTSRKVAKQVSVTVNYSSRGSIEYKGRSYSELSLEVILPVRSKACKPGITIVFFGDDGGPIGGYRATGRQVCSTNDDEIDLPRESISRIATVRAFLNS